MIKSNSLEEDESKKDTWFIISVVIFLFLVFNSTDVAKDRHEGYDAKQVKREKKQAIVSIYYWDR